MPTRRKPKPAPTRVSGKWTTDVDLLTTMDVRNATATTTSTLIGTARDRLLGWAALETDVDVSATFAQIARSASSSSCWTTPGASPRLCGRSRGSWISRPSSYQREAASRAFAQTMASTPPSGGSWRRPTPSLALVGAMGAAIFVEQLEPTRRSPPPYSDDGVRGHGTLKNGTVVARNLYAVSYNAASSDGRAAQARLPRRLRRCRRGPRVSSPCGNQPVATPSSRRLEATSRRNLIPTQVPRDVRRPRPERRDRAAARACGCAIRRGVALLITKRVRRRTVE